MLRKMSLCCVYSIAVVSVIFVLGRICYVTFNKYQNRKKGTCSDFAKTMVILGSGGHTAEMLRIVRHLDFKWYSPRVYIHAFTDKISADKVKSLEDKNEDYKIISIYRSREVKQSYFSSVWSTLVAILNSVPVMWTERPELILCNGPGTCVPLCIVAFLFEILFIQKTTIIFIESLCRVKTLSLTGKILYPIADYIMSSIPIIEDLIPWKSLTEELKSVPAEIKVHLVPMIEGIQTFRGNKLYYSPEWMEDSLVKIEACLDRTWEALNTGYWKDVPIEQRYCYSLCTLVKAALMEIQYQSKIEENARKNTEKEKETFKSIIQQVDKGILLGAPLPNTPNLLPTIASKLNERCIEYSDTSNSDEIIVNNKTIVDALLPGFSPVQYYETPSMETFYKDIFMPKVPAILQGCMKHWKALKLWQNSEYLTKLAGSRTVPIEIGSRYTDENWTQRLINFSEFLQTHVIRNNDKVGYLAQHQLFDQIPELRNDFAIPDYCSFSVMEGEEQPDINAWFGPGGTVSPLHFDPKNNLLCQVFGYKRIILYDPDDTGNLYPYETNLLNNTAQVDPVKPDYNKWPGFQKAKGIMCYLKPGEMLYIPPKWWHHVTALSPSFSVSFWWS